MQRHGRVGISTQGRTRDTVSRFAYEAWAAHATVKLYEAATRLGRKVG